MSCLRSNKMRLERKFSMLWYIRSIQKHGCKIDILEILTIPRTGTCLYILNFLLTYISINWTFLSSIKCDPCQTLYTLLYLLSSYIICSSTASISQAPTHQILRLLLLTPWKLTKKPVTCHLLIMANLCLPLCLLGLAIKFSFQNYFLKNKLNGVTFTLGLEVL